MMITKTHFELLGKVLDNKTFLRCISFDLNNTKVSDDDIKPFLVSLKHKEYLEQMIINISETNILCETVDMS